MLTALRAEANSLMAAAAPARRPALRHADCEDWLLCSDVPQLLDAPALEALLSDLSRAGWQTSLQNGWLYLDKPVPIPLVDTTAPLTGEAACAASLLRRHPNDVQLPSAVRALCCAHDKGPVQVEKLCRQLHRQFSARLRQHQPLPGLLLPYLIRAATFKEETP